MNERNSGNIWLYGLLTLVALFLCATVFSMIKAGKEVSRVVDTKYYEHGLHYVPGDTNAAAAPLGWRAVPSYRNGRIELKITDRNGAPVTGGTLSVTIEGKGVPAGQLTCQVTSPGVYCVPSVPAQGGTFKVMWHFRRNGETMTGRMTVVP